MTEEPTGQVQDRNAKGPFYYQIAAGLFTLLVLVQAVLAGRGWFIDFDLIDIHGMVGNLVFLVAVAMVAIARFGMTDSSERKTLVIMSGILVLLVVAQIGLGYSATSDSPSGEAAAFHIPNGVLIFGLAAAIDSRVFGRRS